MTSGRNLYEKGRPDKALYYYDEYKKRSPGDSSVDAEILRIEIVHSGATCDSATQFNFDTDGGSGDGTSAPLNNIGTAKIYATGNSATFATGNLFGVTGPEHHVKVDWEK